MVYQTAKKILTTFLPQKFLFEHEVAIRKIFLPLYVGHHAECNVCRTKLKKFEKLENGNLLCPICGSLPRTRRLHQLLTEKYLKPNISVLDFSPSRALYREFKKRSDIHYFPTDFENEFLADYQFDITKIDAKSEKFDLIICYHILEHIPDDRAAMNELYRVLKKNGTLLVQTPFKEGEIYEDAAIKTPEERLVKFGQEDHVRIYSAEGLADRLKNAGFCVQIQNFEKKEYNGFYEGERILICKKK